MKALIKRGSTSKLLRIFVQNSTATSVSGLTGITSASPGLTWYYAQEGGASTQVTLTGSAVVGTWQSGGIVAVDGTNMPGVYEIGVPDAALGGSTAGSVVMVLQGVTSMSPVLIEIELVAVDHQSATAFVTSVPAIATAGVNTLVTAVWQDATSGDFTTTSSIGKLLYTGPPSWYSAPPTPPTTTAIATAVWQDATSGDFTTTSSIGKLLYTGPPTWYTAPPATATIAAAILATPAFLLATDSTGRVTVNDKTGYSLATSQSFNTSGSVGSVTGSVGSVSGAVGSVTGLTTATIAAAILTTPANLLVTDTSGRVILQPTQTGVTIPTVTTVTNAVTAGTVSDKSGYSLATSQSFNTSGSVGSVTGAVGSVSGAVGSVTGLTTTTIAAAILATPARLLQTDASGNALISGTQVWPMTGNTSNSTADCMNAARSQGFGRWTLVGTSLTLYGPDGTTVVKTLTVDSATTPHERA